MQFTPSRIPARVARFLRRSWSLPTAVPFFLLVFVFSSVVQSADVARVQEDWELVLDEVSESKQAPQFETMMSPLAVTDESFCRVTWNYRELPDYVPGGFQMQSWVDDSALYRRDCEAGLFTTAGETVTWTQELEIHEDHLHFTVKNGQSTTWGEFGGDDVRLRALPALSNLDGYDSAASVKGSGITYGANRVIRLRIKEVRRYDANGVLLGTDSTSRVVHER